MFQLIIIAESFLVYRTPIVVASNHSSCTILTSIIWLYCRIVEKCGKALSLTLYIKFNKSRLRFLYQNPPECLTVTNTTQRFKGFHYLFPGHIESVSKSKLLKEM